MADRRGAGGPSGQLLLPLQGCGRQSPPTVREGGGDGVDPAGATVSVPLPSGPPALSPSSRPASSLTPTVFTFLKLGLCFAFRPLKMRRQYCEEVLGDGIPKLQSLQTME